MAKQKRFMTDYSITLKVSEEMLAWLRSAANNEESSMQAIIRQAIKAYRQQKEKDNGKMD